METESRRVVARASGRKGGQSVLNGDIHTVVQPLPPSISRTFWSSPTVGLWRQRQAVPGGGLATVVSFLADGALEAAEALGGCLGKGHGSGGIGLYAPFPRHKSAECLLRAAHKSPAMAQPSSWK